MHIFKVHGSFEQVAEIVQESELRKGLAQKIFSSKPASQAVLHNEISINKLGSFAAHQIKVSRMSEQTAIELHTTPNKYMVAIYIFFQLLVIGFLFLTIDSPSDWKVFWVVPLITAALLVYSFRDSYKPEATEYRAQLMGDVSSKFCLETTTS